MTVHELIPLPDCRIADILCDQDTRYVKDAGLDKVSLPVVSGVAEDDFAFVILHPHNAIVPKTPMGPKDTLRCLADTLIVPWSVILCSRVVEGLEIDDRSLQSPGGQAITRSRPLEHTRHVRRQLIIRQLRRSPRLHQDSSSSNLASRPRSSSIATSKMVSSTTASPSESEQTTATRRTTSSRSSTMPTLTAMLTSISSRCSRPRTSACTRLQML